MNFENDIINCLAVLKEGGIILYPTDTIWGIGCDATNARAVEKIYRLKKRSDEKAMIVLVADEQSVMRYVANIDLSAFDYIKENVKPTTIIYEGAIGLAENLVAKDGTIGIRICKDEFCKHLIKRFQKPIVSTSANISGEPSPGNFYTISAIIKNNVNYVVQYRQNDERIAEPSSVIKWQNGMPVVLRQ